MGSNLIEEYITGSYFQHILDPSIEPQPTDIDTTQEIAKINTDLFAILAAAEWSAKPSDLLIRYLCDYRLTKTTPVEIKKRIIELCHEYFEKHKNIKQDGVLLLLLVGKLFQLGLDADDAVQMATHALTQLPSLLSNSEAEIVDKARKFLEKYKRDKH